MSESRNDCAGVVWQWRRLLLPATALCSYALVAAAFTFPLFRHPTATFPGAGDDVYGFIWNNWWIEHSVTVLHSKPYVTNFIFAPFPIDLRLHTLGLLYGLAAIPAMAVLGPVSVLNTQILATVILNGYAMDRLTTYVTKDRGAGLLSGVLVASTPAINFHLTAGRPSCAAVWPAIMALHAFLRLVDEPDRWRILWLAATVAATMLTDQQATLFCISWLAVLFVFHVFARRSPAASVRLALAVAAAAALTMAPAYVLLWRPLVGITGYTVPGAVEAFDYSYPLQLLWTPSMVWSVYGLVAPMGLVAAIALVSRLPALGPWVFGSGLFIALSLGPVVMGTDVRLPFSFMRALPGLEQFRTPYRFQIPAAIGMAVVAGMVVSHTRANRWWVARRPWFIVPLVLAIADLLAHRVASGFQVRTMPPVAVYEEIARDPRDCLVLEVPVGVRTGTDRIGSGEALTFYQPIHGKRLVNGFVARAPLEALAYYRASPAMMFLANETPPDGDIALDLRGRLRDLDVGYVVIHKTMMDEAWVARTLDVFSGIEGLRRLATSTDVVAFRVETSR